MAGRRDSAHKALLYLRPGSYWAASRSTSARVPSKLGYFPLDLRPRLREGHFRDFDDDGLPRRRSRESLIYNYTTLCAYGLANWALYLDTGDPSYSQLVL